MGIVEPIGKMLGSKTIIVVVKDFNLHSIYTNIPPLEIELDDRYISQVAVHYKSGSLSHLIPVLESDWKKMESDRIFSYTSIEDLIQGLYTKEKNLTTIVSISALFTLFIAAFGLFGHTLFVAKTRTKEIGIKKIFGSSKQSIIYSFLKDSFLLVMISAVVSIPLTIYVMTK